MNLLKNCRYGLMIYNNSDIWIGKSIEKYGEFSESEVQVFRDVIKNGDVVLDIGANIGCHSIAFSRLVGDQGHVFAYEPERVNFNTLCGNIAINNIMNIYPNQKAVGSQNGFIHIPELDRNLTVNFGGLSLLHDYSNAPGYEVPLILIDEMNFNRIDFIKIDIEGMEKNAIEGGCKTIEKYKPVLYVEDDREENHEILLDLLKSMGYICYKHMAPMFNPNNFYHNNDDVFMIKNDSGDLTQVVSGNLFCYHKEKQCPINPEKFAMNLV